MEIRDFVTQTLKQITEGAKAASDNRQRFYLDTSTSKGVHFNLAVVNTEIKSKSAGGRAGANILQIARAEIGKGSNSSTSSESVSRIEFNIKYDTPASSPGVVTRPRPGRIQSS